jgi:uncharacterized phage infection (PIP) family protein YhgE
VSISAVSAVPAITGATSVANRDSVSQLRAKIAQMKEKLESIKKDPKTDCKTKDWQMQSLQRAIAQTQQQVTAQTVKATKTEESAPVKSVEKNDTVNSEGSVGARVDCYA